MVGGVNKEGVADRYDTMAVGISSLVLPSSRRPAFFFRTPPHCLKKNATSLARHWVVLGPWSMQATIVARHASDVLSSSRPLMSESLHESLQVDLGACTNPCTDCRLGEVRADTRWQNRSMSHRPWCRRAGAQAFDTAQERRLVSPGGNAMRWSLESGRRDSNPRRPAWEAGILPLNYGREDFGNGVQLRV